MRYRKLEPERPCRRGLGLHSPQQKVERSMSGKFHRPEINATYAGPLYEQVSEKMKDLIRSESWKVGQTLPNEVDLAKRFAVSLGTMRSALRQMEETGWVMRRQGRGTVVQDLGDFYARKYWRYHAPLPDSDGLPNIVTTEISRLVRPLSDASRRDLRCRQGDALQIERVITAADDVCILETITIPMERVPGIETVSPLPPSLFALLDREFGHRLARTVELVEARTVTAEEAQRMGRKGSFPVLQVSLFAYNAADEPICRIVQVAVLGRFQYRVAISL
ncbi:MAG: GntR family transcriptional regulator [Hyphomicrobiaceae bacterium]|nr:GntR family transcriptional regulator [Hyphomicrobiaceae bacterium]